MKNKWTGILNEPKKWTGILNEPKKWSGILNEQKNEPGFLINRKNEPGFFIELFGEVRRLTSKFRAGHTSSRAGQPHDHFQKKITVVQQL
jgi:hypothetical protein